MINVSQQLKSTIGTVKNYTVDDVIDVAGTETPVQGELTLTRTDRGILVKGEVRARVGLNCGRCLSPFERELVMNLAEEYFPTTDVVTGLAALPPDDPGSFTIDEHHILDVTEAVRQYALLATPMKPLCHEDCAGLCPVCGGNLNLKSCRCAPAGAQRSPGFNQ